MLASPNQSSSCSLTVITEKEGCDFDFQNYGKWVTPGGFLAFHDYDPTRNNFGPTWVVEQKVLPNPEWAPFKRVDSLWVARRTQVS